MNGTINNSFTMSIPTYSQPFSTLDDNMIGLVLKHLPEREMKELMKYKDIRRNINTIYMEMNDPVYMQTFPNACYLEQQPSSDFSRVRRFQEWKKGKPYFIQDKEYYKLKNCTVNGEQFTKVPHFAYDEMYKIIQFNRYQKHIFCTPSERLQYLQIVAYWAKKKAIVIHNSIFILDIDEKTDDPSLYQMVNGCNALCIPDTLQGLSCFPLTYKNANNTIVIKNSWNLREIFENAFTSYAKTVKNANIHSIMINSNGNHLSWQCFPNVLMLPWDVIFHPFAFANLIIQNILSFDRLVPSLFENCTITNVQLCEPLEIIPKRCFYGCKGFTQITIPNSVKIIDDEAFFNTDIHQVNINLQYSNLTKIGWHAFNKGVLIKIPESTKFIDIDSFY